MQDKYEKNTSKQATFIKLKRVYQASFRFLTMKRRFLLHDGKKLSVDVKDEDFAGL